MHNAKAIPTTRTAGGLFVLQSSVFRISEKLLNGEQGHALTANAASGITPETAIFLIFFVKFALVAIASDQNVRHLVWGSSHDISDGFVINTFLREADDFLIILNIICFLYFHIVCINNL